jgi:hypothetical protein
MPRPGPVALLAVLLLAACVHRYYDTEAGPLESPPEPVPVEAALRAHLSDGSVALFRSGATVGPAALEGQGIRYDLTRRDSFPITRLSMDSVVGIESFTQRLNGDQTFLVSTAATIGAVVLTVGGLVAIACAADPKCFGSCPTVYSDSGGVELLEAELFSFSIAPLLEGRDVDALAAGARDGVVRLDVRNEAMETHYLNHLQLLELRHEPGERIAPDVRGIPLASRAPAPPTEARDGGGRDVLGALRHADDAAFATTAARLASVSAGDLEDHVELTFPRPPGDSAALVLRVRNSLLNTVLFYDMMLGAAGARALDWMGGDLHRIGDAVRLGRWWSARMGLRVRVLEGEEWVERTRLPDTGPIAWTDVALPIAIPAAGPADDGTVRVRLVFPADAWRIDRAALAPFRRPEPRVHDVARLVDAEGGTRDSALLALRTPDERYVQTVAGDRFTVEFDVGPDPGTGRRSFLLSSQGYYTEWVRPAWIRGAGTGEAFEPSDASLLEAMRRWRGARPEFERKFYETRIPTR